MHWHCAIELGERADMLCVGEEEEPQGSGIKTEPQLAIAASTAAPEQAASAQQAEDAQQQAAQGESSAVHNYVIEPD